MSRRRHLALLFALLIPIAGGQAQTAAYWKDSAQRLAFRLKTMRDSLLQGDSTVEEIVRQGALRLGASENLREEAIAALPRFLLVRDRWFGGALPSPDGFRIVLRTGGPEGRSGVLILSELPDTGNATRSERQVRPGGVSDGLIDVYGELMYARLGPALRKWLDLTPPLSLPEREGRNIAMYSLVTGTGNAQRRCVAGELADCAYALGLRPPTTDDPGGAYASFLRNDLLLTALERGGSKAWHRLMVSRELPAELALSNGAGIPADSLLAHWRRELLALRPSQGLLDFSHTLAAVAWTGVLLLGALVGRGSRWR